MKSFVSPHSNPSALLHFFHSVSIQSYVMYPLKSHLFFILHNCLKPLYALQESYLACQIYSHHLKSILQLLASKKQSYMTQLSSRVQQLPSIFVTQTIFQLLLLLECNTEALNEDL